MHAPAELDRLIAGGLGIRYSAAVARIERHGNVVYERAFGHMRDCGGATVFVDTRFDLASITKVFVTTVALVLVARGMLDLDAPLADRIVEWQTNAHGAITLRQILAHAGGFRSGADYRTLLDADIEAFALHTPLVAVPGERVVYSDIGFFVLGVVIARAGGIALQSALERELRSLGVRSVGYEPRGAVDAVPATERDSWRGLVEGRVHDEKAALAGGVAGHAGLFGTARDVARLAEWYLAPRCGRSGPLPAALALEATREQAGDSVLRRGLGWALKTSDENSCGAAMSHATFGHTGFTGTCVWADPQRDLTVVLLTNAVHFGRGDLRDVRAAVCDAAIAAYGV